MWSYAHVSILRVSFNTLPRKSMAYIDQERCNKDHFYHNLDSRKLYRNCTEPSKEKIFTILFIIIHHDFIVIEGNADLICNEQGLVELFNEHFVNTVEKSPVRNDSLR